MPAFTFNATLQALEWNDLIPVVVDVDDNGQMRPDLVEDYLTSVGTPRYTPDELGDVGGIMPVHMWGNLCDTSVYRDFRAMYNLPVFFDGAHVLGSFGSEGSISQYRVMPGTATVFSIAATKPVSAGEGGLIVTNDTELYMTLRDSTFHGLCGSLDTKVRGINGKIQEFNSILAYHALKCFDKTRERRRQLMEFYRNSFEDLPIRVWETREGVNASYKDCVLFTETWKKRNQLDAFLQARGIGTKRYFEPAIPDMGSFKGIVHSADNARKLAATCLTLPLYPALLDVEVEYVVRAVTEFFI
jgi:dTDP-4-amino-4,6-dideoxygalactose transaminase